MHCFLDQVVWHLLASVFSSVKWGWDSPYSILLNKWGKVCKVLKTIVGPNQVSINLNNVECSMKAVWEESKVWRWIEFVYERQI